MSKAALPMFNPMVFSGEALCSRSDPDAFFPETGDSTRLAKQVCGQCEIKAECLEFALQADERHGIWGGLTPRERARLRTPDRMTRTQRIKHQRDEEIRKLSAQGHSSSTIAEHFHITERTVTRALNCAEARGELLTD